MKRGNLEENGQGGYVLASVMILVFAIFIIGSGFFSLVGSEVRSSQSYLDSQQAFWLAEGAKERALRYLSELPNPPQSDFFIYQDVDGPGGTYTVHCLVDSMALWDVKKSYVIDCVGESRGIKRRVRQWVTMTSFAQYAMFTDEESNGRVPLWYISGDEIEGRLHTNGTFHISGNPRFRGKVSSTSDHMVAYPGTPVHDMGDWPVGRNTPTFAQGADLGAPLIEMPTTLPDLRGESRYGGIYSPVETDVELGVTGAVAATPAPGWLRYRDHSDPTAPWTSVEISALTNRVFYSEGDVHVEGVLDGELTVASRRDVRIVDDITYESSDSHGTPPPGCDDLLGLVAERNVVFANNTANQNDLVINAVLMALDTSITAEDYYLGSPRGTLTIWGGLIQKYRGAVGQFRYGRIVHGYQKDYHYDSRVTGRAPPTFPSTGVYEKTVWEETWDDTDPF